jgi:hypothetical protein
MRFSQMFMLVGTVICMVVRTEAEANGAYIAGAGTGVLNQIVNTPGPLVIVDKEHSVFITKGTYSASVFNYDAATPGDVTPFLCIRSGTGYRVLAVGTTQNITAPAQDVAVPFGPNYFTIDVQLSDLFAGIVAQNQNPIPYQAFGGFVAYEASGQPASSYAVAVGQIVPADGAFSNPDSLGAYAFSVEAVLPEPSTPIVLAVASASLLASQRSRRSLQT